MRRLFENYRKTRNDLVNLHHPDNYDSISAKKQDMETFTSFYKILIYKCLAVIVFSDLRRDLEVSAVGETLKN